MLNKCLINIQCLCDDCVFLPNNLYYYHCLWRIYVFYGITRVINIILVNKKKMIYLNFKYRNKNNSTNVLSFCYFSCKFNFVDVFFPLGDIILSPLVILEESYINKYSYFFHFFHILIHGILHVLGFKHDSLLEAKKMKKIEYFFLVLFKNDN